MDKRLIDEDSSDIPRTRIFHKRTMKKTLKICSIIAILFVLTEGKPSKIFSKKEQPKNVQKKNIEYKSLYQDIQSLSEKITKAEENIKDSDVSLQEKNYRLAMREGFDIFYSAAQNFFSKGPPPPENSIDGNGSAILKANNSEINYNNSKNYNITIINHNHSSRASARLGGETQGPDQVP